VKLITPQFEDLAVLDSAALERYLADKHLVVTKTRLRQVCIAFPAVMLPLVDDVIHRRIACIASQDRSRLAGDVESSLRDNEFVAFAPSHRGMRDFHNTQGFCRAMSELSMKIGNCETALPPGLYGDRHMIVWRRIGDIETRIGLT
jgi:hypothetical protein